MGDGGMKGDELAAVVELVSESVSVLLFYGLGHKSLSLVLPRTTIPHILFHDGYWFPFPFSVLI